MINNIQIINSLDDIDFNSIDTGYKFIEVNSQKNINKEEHKVNVGYLQYSLPPLYSFSTLNNNFDVDISGYNIHTDASTIAQNLNMLVINNDIIRVDSFNTRVDSYDNLSHLYKLTCQSKENNTTIERISTSNRKQKWKVVTHYIVIDMGTYFLAAIITNKINLTKQKLLQNIDYLILDKDKPMLKHVIFSCNKATKIYNLLLTIRETISEDEQNKLDILLYSIEVKNKDIKQIITNPILMNKFYKTLENPNFDYISVANELLSPILVEEQYNYKAYNKYFDNVNADICSTYPDNIPAKQLVQLNRKAKAILEYELNVAEVLINIYTGKLFTTQYKIIYKDAEGIILQHVKKSRKHNKIFFVKTLGVYCRVTNGDDKQELKERYDTYKILTTK